MVSNTGLAKPGYLTAIEAMLPVAVVPVLATVIFTILAWSRRVSGWWCGFTIIL